MEYWVGRGGQQLGPYSVPDLRRMISEGRVAQTDLAWKEGMANWQPLSQVLPAEAPQYTPPPPASAPPPPAHNYGQPPAPAYAQPQPAAQAVTPQYAQPGPPAAVQNYGQPQHQQQPQHQHQPQQGYNPQPAYGGYPPAAQMGMPMGAQMVAPGGGPIPPDMHWAVVLLIGAVTCGIFTIYWVFKEASFVQQIDPNSKAKKLFTIGILLYVAYFALMILGIVMVTAGAATQSAGPGVIGMILPLMGMVAMPAAAICMIIAIFNMRTSLVNYYNSVEPIQLKLSPIMTFFFTIYYFQYHFMRIAQWKKTGQLTPQQ